MGEEGQGQAELPKSLEIMRARTGGMTMGDTAALKRAYRTGSNASDMDADTASRSTYDGLKMSDTLGILTASEKIDLKKRFKRKQSLAPVPDKASIKKWALWGGQSAMASPPPRRRLPSRPLPPVPANDDLNCTSSESEFVAEAADASVQPVTSGMAALSGDWNKSTAFGAETETTNGAAHWKEGGRGGAEYGDVDTNV